MPSIILASRYLKKASPGKLSNLIKYIGTREGVEFNKSKMYFDTTSTEKQKELLQQLEKSYPDIKNLLEYEDYILNPTAENASELIGRIVEEYADQISGINNFVRYMAMRPNVEKIGSHGLFSQTDEPISLNKIADEIANHEGNIWSHVLSLRREDAERLNYNNQNAFKNLIRKNVNALAKYHKIPFNNLKWYAAFHNESHHPHIHLIVYSTDVTKGYLSDYGIKQLKSVFENNIFVDELHTLYDEQTDIRNKLRFEAAEKAMQLVHEIDSGACENPLIESLIIKLNQQLSSISGKKVYGYLPKSIKKTVDEIVRELATDERISELYQKWYELDLEKVKNYKDRIPDFVPLEQQKEFRSIKNSVIKAALSLSFSLNDTEFYNTDLMTSLPDPEPADDKNKKYRQSESDFYENNDGYRVFIKAKDLIEGEEIKQDVEKGIELLKQSIMLGCHQAAYYLGKIYLDGIFVQQDTSEAIQWFTVAADRGNMYAAYKLGKIYSSEEFNKLDFMKAAKWFIKTADNGNDMAQYALSILLLKEFYNPQEAIRRLEDSAAHDNEFALLKLGRILLEGKLLPKDVKRAICLLERSAEKNNSYAQYALGKLFLYGLDVSKDVEKALYYLNQSASQNNPFAKRLLERYETAHFSFGVVLGLFQDVARIFANRMDLQSHLNRVKAEKKLLSKIAMKKFAHGIKIDNRKLTL